MKRIYILLFLISNYSLLKAQDESKFGIKFSGFVKTDINYDTRQTVNIREGHFLLYPDNVVYDTEGKDINAKGNFNILSIQSRLKGTISGPEAFGAKTSGVIEADFFGNAGSGLDDVNGFRLRHAFVKLNWKSTEILAGQYWHPMFIAESFPDVISFNTGAPFQPFARNPQVRVSQSFGNLSSIVTVFTQRDFQSTGPDGSSSKYLRNAGVPNTNLQLQYKPASSEHLLGAGIDYKSILPELYTMDKDKKTKYKSTEKLNSLSAFVFGKLKFKPITFKFQAVYAQNAHDLLMIGGYAVKEIKDTITGAKEFANLNTMSAWSDIQSNGKKIQAGLFAGYSKNSGSDKTITNTFYARGANIDYLYRIAPRVVFISGKLNIAFELEYTFAMYGTANGDGKGGVSNGYAVDNTRGLLSFIYKF